MIQMDVRELCTAITGEIIAGRDGAFHGVSIDSRKIESGQLFFAIIGENLDGHEFVAGALMNGGAGAIVSRAVEVNLRPGQFIIRVADTTKALQELARYYRRKFDLKIVGITGSVGKTTTKDMIAAVLAEKYRVLKTEGNLNNYYGLPLTLFKLGQEYEALVVEMGMSALKEIELLAQIAEPEVGVVTNVGSSHLEYLKTLDNVAIGKQELVENLTGRRIAVLNVDDPRVKQMAKLANQAIFYGLGVEAEYQAVEVANDGLEGVQFILKAENEEMPVYLPLPGEHNALNALAAIAVGRVFGMSFLEIQAGLDKFRPSKMRMDIREIGPEITLLNDAYNANPESMKAGLKVLASRPGRKIAVMGDMLELGAHAENAHREVGKFAAEHGIDLIFVKGNFAGWVTEGAFLGGMKMGEVFTFATNDELAKELLPLLKAGDTILVKGSRGMKMEEVVKQMEEKFEGGAVR